MEWERDAAAEWALGPKEEARPEVKKHVPIFTTRRDNAAQVEWRKGTVEPTATVRLPRDFAPKEQRPQKRSGGRDQRKDAQLTAFNDKLEEISSMSGSHVSLLANAGCMYLAIWGTGDQADHAKRLIKEWIDETRAPQIADRKTKWAHIPSLTEQEKKTLYAKLDAELRRQQFRRAMPPDRPENEMGCFLWPPDDEVREQVLGASFEALDPIRMEESCYISFNSTNSVLTVWGSTNANVQRALVRTRAIYYQIRARYIEATTFYLFKPLQGSSLRTEVELVNYTDVGKDPTPMVCPRIKMTSEMLPDDERSTRKNAVEGTNRLHAVKIKRSVMRVLHHIEYHRGHLRLRARLGTFVLTSYKKREEYPISEFEDMMENPQVAGHVIQNIGRRNMWEMFLLVPDFVTLGNGAMSGNDGSKPTYTATFTVNGPDDIGTLQYEVRYIYDEQTKVIECVSKRWARLNYGKRTLHKLLDIYLVDLEGPPSWNIEITAGHLIDESKYPALVRWMEHAKFEIDIATQPLRSVSEKFMQWKPVAGIQLLSYQQKTTSHFAVRGTPYVCEVERVQDFTVAGKARATVQSVPTGPKDGKAYWAVSVFRPEWDTALAANGDLGIGEGVQQKASETGLFGMDYVDGFEVFLGKLDELAKLMVRGDEST